MAAPSPELANTGQEAISGTQDPAFQFPVLPDPPRGRSMTWAGRLEEATAWSHLLDSFPSPSVALGYVSAESLLDL